MYCVGIIFVKNREIESFTSSDDCYEPEASQQIEAFASVRCKCATWISDVFTPNSIFDCGVSFKYPSTLQFLKLSLSLKLKALSPLKLH